MLGGQPNQGGNFALGLQTLWRCQLNDLSLDEMVGAWCFGCLSGQPGFTCWISFAPVFGFIYCWVLNFALSPCYILIYMFQEMMHWWVKGLSCKPNIYVSWSTSELRVRLVPWNRFKPSSKIFYCPFQGGSSFVDLLCFFCLVFAIPLCASVYLCLAFTRLERADLLALVCGV